MSEEDRQYFYDRAEQELLLAQAATHPAAVTSHFRLAERYLDLAYDEVDENAPPQETSDHQRSENRSG
jgi:hypothetical protein